MHPRLNTSSGSLAAKPLLIVTTLLSAALLLVACHTTSSARLDAPTPATMPILADVVTAAPPGAAPADTAADALAADQFAHQVTPLLQTYCYECHGNGKHASNLALDSYKTVDSVNQDWSTWETVLRFVRTHQMPPTGHDPQPSDDQRATISNWIDGQLDRYYAHHPDPGRVTLHRLNRAEYNNTIRDLIGVDFHPADDFPPDDSGYGFDNIGDVLSLPPMLMEKYLAAADRILDPAIVTDPIVSRITRIPASLGEVGFNAFGDRGDGWVKLVTLEDDDVAITQPILAAGDYKMRVLAFTTPDGGVQAYDAAFGARSGGLSAYQKGIATNVPPIMSFLLNDALVKTVTVTADEEHPQVYEARIGVPAGNQRFRAAFRRIRGGDNEFNMKNGRLGREQPGILYVKYIELEGPLPCATRRSQAVDLPATGEHKTLAQTSVQFTGAGDVSMDINVPHDGDFLLRAQAYADQAGTEPARMEFRVDGKTVQTFDVIAPGYMLPLANQRIFSMQLLIPAPEVYEYRAHLTAGTRKFSVAFINPFSDPKNTNPNLHVRDLVVQNLEVAGEGLPVPTPPMPAPLASLFEKFAPSELVGDIPAADATPAANAAPRPADPLAVANSPAARSILGEFTRRAWRRPVLPGELDRVMLLYNKAIQEGDTFRAGVKLAMKGVLVSPHFLFRGDIAPKSTLADKSGTASPPSIHLIDEYALASRLSYFLWSSTPDDELLDLASRGQLRDNLEPQVHRMLASPKARALTDNFASQWLEFRAVQSLAPDKEIYPDFDTTLRNSMQKETELFFQYIMTEDRSIIDFVDADYTFVDSRLAEFYGIPNVTGEEFRKVSLQGLPRRGLITQGSVLALTSNPSRTSPVKRGKWVLENIVGAPPPPPPPNVPSLDDPKRALAGTLRQQMEQHRANPTCYSCHAAMDPIGFGLENFDGIGAYRTADGEAPIDPAGALVTGDSFSGPLELTQVLSTTLRPYFVNCLSDKMLTYAMGRGTEYYDRAAIDEIARNVTKDHYRFSSLIMEVVKSVPFQMERGESALASN